MRAHKAWAADRVASVIEIWDIVEWLRSDIKSNERWVLHT